MQIKSKEHAARIWVSAYSLDAPTRCMRNRRITFSLVATSVWSYLLDAEAENENSMVRPSLGP